MLKTRLKADLLIDAPLKGHRNYSEIREGQNDYDACFRNWWLVGVDRDKPGEVVIAWGAGDAAATLKGIVKYRSRIVRIAGQVFKGIGGKKLGFIEQRGGT